MGIRGKRVHRPWKIFKHYVANWEQADGGKGVPCETPRFAPVDRASKFSMAYP